MIELSNEIWEEYNHAYGNASDIPSLLENLSEYPISNGYEAEPYLSLWSALCHQGDVYSASYAAVPHIVSYIEVSPNEVGYDYFLLPVCIEIARVKGNGPDLSSDLELEYKSALKKLLELVPKIKEPDESYSNVLSATVAACNGNTELAEIILELTSEVRKEFWKWFYER